MRAADKLTWQDWRHLLVAGGLLGGVLGTLVLAASLQVDGETSAHAPAQQQTTAPEPGALPPATPRSIVPRTAATLPDGAAPEAAVEPTATDDAGAPQAAPDDARRLLGTGDEWTLQFMVTCREDVARDFGAQLGGDPRLFLLPVIHDGRSCYRVCWGSYRTREQAVSQQALPGALAALNATPIPRRITDLAP